MVSGLVEMLKTVTEFYINGNRYYSRLPNES